MGTTAGGGSPSSTPVGRAGERRGQAGFLIAVRGIELGLGEKDAPGEVGAAQVGASEVGSGEVGRAQVSAGQVGTDEAGAAQAGPGQVGAAQVLSGEVGASEVGLLAPDIGAREFARAQQQGIDVPPVRAQVKLREGLRAAAGETLGLVERAAEFSMDQAGLRSVSASVRYQSSSWSCRMIANTPNIWVAMAGACRQSRPPKVTWATCCPAPKQS